MWDVKQDYAAHLKCIEGKFYMNYVGCKDQILYTIVNNRYEFYMNYVGCKVRLIVSDFGYKAGFI